MSTQGTNIKVDLIVKFLTAPAHSTPDDLDPRENTNTVDRFCFVFSFCLIFCLLLLQVYNRHYHILLAWKA